MATRDGGAWLRNRLGGQIRYQPTYGPTETNMPLTDINLEHAEAEVHELQAQVARLERHNQDLRIQEMPHARQ